jgi:hypothetical protein
MATLSLLKAVAPPSSHGADRGVQLSLNNGLQKHANASCEDAKSHFVSLAVVKPGPRNKSWPLSNRCEQPETLLANCNCCGQPAGFHHLIHPGCDGDFLKEGAGTRASLSATRAHCSWRLTLLLPDRLKAYRLADGKPKPLPLCPAPHRRSHCSCGSKSFNSVRALCKG